MSESESLPVANRAVSSLGLPARRVARLAYLPVAGFIMLVIERSSRLVRFHAAQASILYLLWTAVALAQPVLARLLTAIGDHSSSSGANVSSTAAGLSACGGGIIYLALLAALIFGAISAGHGRFARIPMISPLALWLMARVPVVEPDAGDTN